MLCPSALTALRLSQRDGDRGGGLGVTNQLLPDFANKQTENKYDYNAAQQESFSASAIVANSASDAEATLSPRCCAINFSSFFFL